MAKYPMLNQYQDVYQSEIHAQSRCIWHENVLLDWMRSQLIQLGYQPVSQHQKTWQRGKRTVVTCVVDDVSTCATQDQQDTARLWNAHTDVITDNRILTPTVYNVHQLPQSFFGIYCYSPRPRVWTPAHRFCLSVYRIDMKRQLLLLELERRRPFDRPRSIDLLNFNCWSWQGNNDSIAGLVDNWNQQFALLDQDLQKLFEPQHAVLASVMPLRNHEHDIDAAPYHAWLNTIVETYSGDNIVALSEKIFRALVAPVPWTVYSGRYTVACLESMGFDCASDIIDHGYDSLQENNSFEFGDKPVDWWWRASETVEKLQNFGVETVRDRMQQAATHNQQLLGHLQQQWPHDLAAWWPAVLEKLHKN